MSEIAFDVVVVARILPGNWDLGFEGTKGVFLLVADDSDWMKRHANKFSGYEDIAMMKLAHGTEEIEEHECEGRSMNTDYDYEE